MTRILSVCSLFLAASSAGWGQATPINVLSIVPGPALQAKIGSTVEGKVSLQLRPGFHVNSNMPSDAYLIPLKLTWNAGGALQPDGITYPKPHMHAVGGEQLSVFSGNFDLAVKFKVPANAVQGAAAIAGKLRYQACNDIMCLPPRDLPVTLQIDIVR